MMFAFVPSNSDGAWMGVLVCLLTALCSKKMTTAIFGQLCKLGAVSCVIWAVNAVRAFFLPVQGELRTVSALVGSLPMALIGRRCIVRAVLPHPKKAASCAKN